MRPMKFGVGQSVRRVEDQRFITGAGRYTDSFHPNALSYGVVLRSPYAHANFAIKNTADAKDMPGVLLVLTADDVAHLGSLPCPGAVQNADGNTMATPPYPILAAETVRHVGDAVAFIVGETEEQARAAAEAIEIEWDPLQAVVGISTAETSDILVWPEVSGNLAFDTEMGEKEKTDKAFEKAARVLSLTVVNNRLVTNYLEPRACIGEYDNASQRWTLTLTSQGSHDIRDVMAKSVLHVEPERIRVITPDVGGAFGTKIFPYREYPLCLVAAEKLKRPVKWRADRSEHFLGDTQGRDNITSAEIALTAQGRFLGLRIDLKADMGAYLSQYAPAIPVMGARMSPGSYAIPALHARIRGYYTNTVPVDAYRGAGRPEAAYVIERLVDHVARELRKSPDAIRALNFIKPTEMPYKTATGNVYDSGEFEALMRHAMEKAEWSTFKTREWESKKRRRVRGIGMASYIEACAGGPPESAEVKLEKDGKITVLIGTQSSGQGHLTAYAQLVSQHLDLNPEEINVIQGDTDLIATGMGTGGSRSIPVGGAAVDAASRLLVEKIKHLASDALETGTGDLEISEGRVRVAGTDRAVSFKKIAQMPQATPEMVSATESWKPPAATFPNGTHICELEIDPQTGETEILRYTIVDDFGVTLNPSLLMGQVYGGAVQGIGQALHERTVYDADGQLVTASFMDYGIPRAADIPNFSFETRNIPSTTNILGMKGAGEAGAIGACPAVMNAVTDALFRGFGIRHVDMPATPDQIFRLVQCAGKT